MHLSPYLGIRHFVHPSRLEIYDCSRTWAGATIGHRIEPWHTGFDCLQCSKQLRLCVHLCQCRRGLIFSVVWSTCVHRWKSCFKNDFEQQIQNRPPPAAYAPAPATPPPRWACMGCSVVSTFWVEMRKALSALSALRVAIESRNWRFSSSSCCGIWPRRSTMFVVAAANPLAAARRVSNCCRLCSEIEPAWHKKDQISITGRKAV